MLIASFVSQFRFFCFASFISYFNLVFKTVTIMRTLLHFLNSYFITISKIRIEINALFRVLCNKMIFWDLKSMLLLSQQLRTYLIKFWIHNSSQLNINFDQNHIGKLTKIMVYFLLRFMAMFSLLLSKILLFIVKFCLGGSNFCKKRFKYAKLVRSTHNRCG